jgi:hypothetical protein
VPAVNGEQARDALEQCRLAGTIGPDEAEHFAGANGKARAA